MPDEPSAPDVTKTIAVTMQFEIQIEMKAARWIKEMREEFEYSDRDIADELASFIVQREGVWLVDVELLDYKEAIAEALKLVEGS